MANSYESDFWEPVGRRAGRGYRDESYGRGSQESTRGGSVILAIVSSLCAFLVLLGFVYSLSTSERHKKALAAADCEPSLFIKGLPCTTQQMVLSRYEGIVTPAVQQLRTESIAYETSEMRSLVSAEAALTAEVTTEQDLDNNLSAAMYNSQSRIDSVTAITNAVSFGSLEPPTSAVLFSPQLTVMANTLVGDTQALAKLTAEQARSSSLAQMRSFNARVQAASGVVQNEMQLIRQAAEVRPTVSEEPCAPCF
jgi:hypothetical protein